MSILIKDASVILTQNSRREQIKNASLYIEDDIISELSEKPISVEAEYVINARGMIVLPGLINLHTHIPMTLLRGYGDDMVLQDWLNNRIWPVEAKLDEESISAGTRLGLLEMLRSGTTCFLDMYFFEDTIAKITEEVGLRAFLGFSLLDFGTPEYKFEELFPACEVFLKKWRNSKLVQPVVAPHATYTCSAETLQKSLELAERYDVLLHTHCSETRNEVYSVMEKYNGLRPVEVLKKYGLLCDRTILAHCGWITKGEVSEISKANAKVAHCPVSNMKLATGGFAPIPELLEKNAAVGLGTDGAASNNTLDMFETMKFAALIHKHHRWDPCVTPAQTVLDLATISGAKCLGIENIVGSLEEGKKADVVLVDLRKPWLTPLHDPVSLLVYSARCPDVYATIVDGKILMLNNTFYTIDFNNVLKEAQMQAYKLTKN
jgi:5-methylthioadenosine/S-adenosylhomocysteine deaminase